MHQDFPCLNDALNHATLIFIQERRIPIALDNWLGEQACPPNQLREVTRMRAEAALEQVEAEEMASTPGWGTF
jgi:hypothetical protein